MKNKIIALATELFMTQGYPATSTRQIAKELGISQPALYHHFKNKQEIYIAVLSKFSQEIGTQLLGYINDSNNEDITLLNMSLYLKDTHPMNLSLMLRDIKTELSVDTGQKILKIWEHHYLGPFQEFFRKYYVNYKHDISPNNLALHYLRSLSTYIDGTPDPSNELLVEFVDIFLYGIKISE